MNIKEKAQIIALFIVSLLLLTNSSFSQIQTLYPLIDGYIKKSNADDSFTVETELLLKHSVTTNNDREFFISFSIEDISLESKQVILKLVKKGGNEGNISLVGINSSIDETLTWNNAPSVFTSIEYGGHRVADTCYFDITTYINSQISLGKSTVTLKAFTTSLISSPISVASMETALENEKPQLLFFEESVANIALFNTSNSTTIIAKGDTYNANLLAKHRVEYDERSNYGGWIYGKSTATGFFRVEKDCEGAWHIIDPDGYMFYSAGLNSVVEGGDILLPDSLQNMGINTMGCWSDESISNLAYTPRFNVISNFKNSSDDIKATYELTVLPVFEPTFQSFCEQLAEDELPQYVNDPWVLGYFLDNELPFYKNQLSISLTLATDNAQYAEANKWMTDKYGESYTTADITDTDELEYQGYVAEVYFKTISEAFRAVDPNHMLIGTRFHGGGKYVTQIFESAGKYMDIISVNYYNRFEPEEDAMEMWMEYGQTPFIITEFYTKGEDSGLGNVDGAGWSVPTQQDRAHWYENWMLKLLRNQGNVGFHWFRYIDKEGNDSNKGLFSGDYKLYEPLGESFEKVSQPIYTLRSHILYGNENYNGIIDCDSILCGNTGGCEFNPYATQKTTQTIELKKGWNLISLYIQPDNSPTGTVFLNAEIVKTFDSFYLSTQADFLNTLTEIEAGKGYLVYNEVAETITISGVPVRTGHALSLQEGWNLIGIPSSTSLPLSTYPDAQIIKDFDTFYKVGNDLNTLEGLEPGKAYFINK